MKFDPEGIEIRDLIQVILILLVITLFISMWILNAEIRQVRQEMHHNWTELAKAWGELR